MDFKTRLKNWLRKCKRNPHAGDLRLIRPRFRHLYRDDFNKGSIGHALGALMAAYNAGHFYPESYKTPAERARAYD